MGRGAIDRDETSRRRIGTKLGVLARVLRNSFDREVANLNITRSQWAMIAMVSRSPGATQRVIADALEMSEASAGRLVDKLCCDGLLERREREDDRRARAVYLTEATKPLLEDISTIAENFEERMFDGFREEELDALASYLDRIYDNVAK